MRSISSHQTITDSSQRAQSRKSGVGVRVRRLRLRPTRPDLPALARASFPLDPFRSHGRSRARLESLPNILTQLLELPDLQRNASELLGVPQPAVLHASFYSPYHPRIYFWGVIAHWLTHAKYLRATNTLLFPVLALSRKVDNEWHQSI